MEKHKKPTYMNKLIIASFIGGITAGTKFEESKWPLHVTLMRSLHSNTSPQELTRVLGLALQGQKAFELFGKSEELFGPENDRPVTELELTPQMSALNALLKETFSEHSSQSVPDKYPTYRPHVTRQGEEGISVGDCVRIDSVSIVLVGDEARTIISTIQLT
ncbi:2'-5' RNA ligase family protein [Candidatus Woesebacteria bacterium]|nr:2'-5' RNA ligase family protein [Candidatus Woesebacteria bacterium]